jgi:RNA polymerase sigma factor (sigma-70 family)
MKSRHAKPTQPRFVVMNGQDYAWDATRGLDPSVALEVVGYVRKKAGGYVPRAKLAGLEFEDLVQEGMAGALKAAAKYNPEAGANYLTYAAWWIDAAMKEALSRPIIRTPEGEAFARVDSLDAPMEEDGERGGHTHQDWQRADQPDAHDLSAAAEDRARIRGALPKLNPRDRDVLARHMGLDGRQPQTLQVVARELGVTRQRAGQILDRARADLRQHLAGHPA